MAAIFSPAQLFSFRHTLSLSARHTLSLSFHHVHV